MSTTNSRLLLDDLHFVLSRLPKDVLKLLKEYPLFLAGGFIRATLAGEKVSDIDILGPTGPEMKMAAFRLATTRGGRVYSTDNALTVLKPPRAPVQLIIRWLYDDPAELLSEFDFTIAQTVIWHDKIERWQSMCSPRFYADLAAKRLVYTSPKREEDAGGSMLRVLKFLRRGYSIQTQSLGRVINRLVSGVKPEALTNPEFCEKILISLLREVDPLTIIDGVEPIDDHNAPMKEIKLPALDRTEDKEKK